MTWDGTSTSAPHGRMWLSAATSSGFPTSEWSNIGGFNTDDGDSAGFAYSLGVVTFTASGRIWFDLLTRWVAGGGSRRGARLLLNGNTYKEVVEGKDSASEEVTSLCAIVVDVQAGDTITMQVWQNSGGNLSASGGASFRTSFRIRRV